MKRDPAASSQSHEQEINRMSEESNPLKTPPDPFGEWITDFKEGTVDVHVTQAFAEVVQAVQMWNKPGSVTVTVKVQPNAVDSRYVEICEDVKAKVPTETPDARLLFATPTGRVTAKNPHQSSLDFEKVEDPPPGVDRNTGEIR